MYKIRQDLKIAIKALAYLKRINKPVKVLDMANQLDESKYFSEQVMRKLRLAKLVTAAKGPGGGYAITLSGSMASTYTIAVALGCNPVLPLNDPNTVEYKLMGAIVDAFTKTYI